MRRTFNKTSEILWDWSSFYKSSVRLLIVLLPFLILFILEDAETFQAEIHVFRSGLLAVIAIGCAVFLINLLFVVPYEITSSYYDKNKELKQENRDFQNKLRPRLEIPTMEFRNDNQKDENEGFKIYKLLVECSNPKDSIFPINDLYYYSGSLE